MKRLVILAFLFAVTEFCIAEVRTAANLTKTENQGIKYYNKGKYEKAYERFSDTASWGYKTSQYFLGLMHLKGQHVEQSNVIGMAWLGVASEAGVEEWQVLYQSLYDALSESEKITVDLKLEEYISKFGLKAQNISCEKKPNLRTRRATMTCLPYSGPAELYPTEEKE
jgi:hypothetical protein